MERFFSKVNKTETCWEWTAGLRGKSGYGAFKSNKKVYDAHRFSFILHNGEIPENMLVCHKCDNRKCVNPSHLFLGSYKDNWQDAVNKGRIKPLDKDFSKKFIKHPSLSAYKNRGCRCKECTEINRVASVKYRNKPKRPCVID